jgi:hypothetical protein
MSNIKYIIMMRQHTRKRPDGVPDDRMLEERTRTLLVLPRGVLDDVRALAGRATTALKLPVSVQIVLRALLDEGLKRDGERSLLANIEAQAQSVRRIRSRGGRRRRRDSRSGSARGLDGSAARRREA